MNKIIVGIDISKKKFDVCWLSPDGKVLKRIFKNDPEGFAAFFNFLDQNDSGSCRIAIEATGWYGEDLARAAYDKGHTVFVINPAQIKYFGKSRLSRSKTDKKDARLIADFALTHPDLRPWVPLTASQEKLRSLFRHLSRLKEDHAQLLNRLESDRDEDVRKSSLAQLEFVQDLIRNIQGQIRAHIESDPELKVKAGLLRTIPGVGEMVCWGFLSETPDVRNFNNAKQLAHKIYNKIPILIGSDHLSGVVYAAKNLFNENSKNYADKHEIPEMNHHMLEGLTYPTAFSNSLVSAPKESLIAIFCKSNLYNERCQEYVDLTIDIISKNNIPIEAVQLKSNSKILQVFELLHFMSFVTYYLALLNGVDPSPIPWVDYFKKILAK